MSVRYTRNALRIDQISSYLAQHDPTIAAALLGAVNALVTRLERFPLSAQATEMPEVRAAPLHGYPYVVFYSPEDDGVLIHIRHAARLRPWEES